MSKPATKFRRYAVLAVAFVSGLWVCDRWLASRSNADESAATSPASRPSTRPTLAADVQAVVDRIAAAYGKTPIRVEAEMLGDFDVAGMVEKKSISITGTLGSPAAYRHEAKGEIILTADGSKLHLYDAARNQYTSGAIAGEGDDAVATLRGVVNDLLLQQNPALFIAAGNNAIDAVSFENEAVALLAPTTVDGRALDRLQSQGNGTTYEVWVDRERGTIDRVQFDFTKTLEGKGAKDVKQASVVIRYTKTELASAQPSNELFAFAPPADATPLRLAAPSRPGAGGDVAALVGKPAPAFELKDLDGNVVKLGDAAGSVVVLDFWATWCPPCKEGLPLIARAATKYADRGVKVYAVNVGEDPGTVKAFVDNQKLSLTTLMDIDSGVAGKYGITYFPTTVVIGPDGVLRKVVDAVLPEHEAGLHAAIEAALK